MSGYHQIGIDEESSKLLIIATPSDRYSDTRVDSNTIKNMDDLMFFADSLSELKKKIEEFLWFCKQRTLKLKTSKFVISEEVEFAGSVFLAKLEREDKGLK